MKTSEEAKQAAVNIRQWLAAHVDSSNRLSQTELSERIQVAIDASNKRGLERLRQERNYLMRVLRAIEDYPVIKPEQTVLALAKAMKAMAREAIKDLKD